MRGTLALVLAERFEEIAERWSGGLPATLAVDAALDLAPRRKIGHDTLRRVLESIAEDDRTRLDEVAGNVGNAFVAAGCRLADAQRWLLSLKDLVVPRLVPSDQGDFAAFLAATRTLDEYLSALVFALADAYPTLVARHHDEYVHRLEERNRELERTAIRDGLTDLGNRRYFQERLRTEVRRGHRYGRQVALVLIDVDRFKQLNDSRGHLAGDQALIAVASQIRHGVRDVDVAARYGGDEFAIILPETTAEGGRRVAERIRAGIARAAIPTAGHPGRVTLSIGVAAFPDDATDEVALIESADRALYQSKRRGRDQISLADRLGEAEPSAAIPPDRQERATAIPPIRPCRAGGRADLVAASRRSGRARLGSNRILTGAGGRLGVG